MQLPSFFVKGNDTHVVLHQTLLNGRGWDQDYDMDPTDQRVVYFDAPRGSWVKIYNGELFSDAVIYSEVIDKAVHNVGPSLLVFQDRYSCLTEAHGYIGLTGSDTTELEKMQDDLTYEYMFSTSATKLIDSNEPFGVGTTMESAAREALKAYRISILYVIHPEVYTEELCNLYLREYNALLRSQ